MNNMDINEVKEFAATVKHLGDYGDLWVNQKIGGVYYSLSDGDLDPDDSEAGFTTSEDDILKGFLTIAGVNKVEVELEAGPDEDEAGWEYLGKFGIDNSEARDDYWEKEYDKSGRN